MFSNIGNTNIKFCAKKNFLAENNVLQSLVIMYFFREEYK